MSTPAQPKPHIQRSIFILPGGSRFVNATTAPGSGRSPSTQRSSFASAGISRSEPGVWPGKNLL
jgi:hypothetical protein